MKEESDLVQQLAHAYGDYITLRETIKNENDCDDSVKLYFTIIRKLYAMDNLEKNCAWYMTYGIISRKQSKTITKLSKKYCEDISKYAKLLCKSFGIPEHTSAATFPS